MPETSRAGRIIMENPTYDIDTDKAATKVSSMLLQVGALEWWEVSANVDGNQITAQARFLNGSPARQAAISLDTKLLPFSTSVRLTVCLMATFKFRLSSRLYSASLNHNST